MVEIKKILSSAVSAIASYVRISINSRKTEMPQAS